MKLTLNFLIKTISFVFILMTSSAYCQPSADVRKAFDRLDQIRILADQDSTKAYKESKNFENNILIKHDNVQLKFAFYKQSYAIYNEANQYKEADKLIRELRKLATENKDADQVLIADLFLMSKLIYDGEMKQSLRESNELKNKVEASNNREVHFLFNLNMGAIKEILGQYDKAIIYYLKALELSDYQIKRKDHVRLNVLHALSGFYVNQKDPKKALEINTEALELAKKLNAKMSNVSNLLMTQGYALFDLGRKEESLISYKESLRLAQLAKNDELELRAMISMNDYYLKTEQFIESKKIAIKALALAEKLGNKANEAVTKINLGLSLAYLGDFKNGVTLINEGVKFQREGESPKEMELTLREIASMYEKIGKPIEALKILREQQKLSDEIFSSESAIAVANVQEQFEAEQRAIQINLLEKENALQESKIQNYQLQIAVMILAAILLIVIGIATIVLYLKMKKSNIKLKEANALLEFHAERDPLTGLFNRRSFFNLMKTRDASYASDRRSDADITDTMIVLDLDFFKRVNDDYGHAAGDAVLSEVAKRLGSVVRETDMVLRWGGEEFLIYSRKSKFAEVIFLVERVLKIIGSTPIVYENKAISITATVGFISLPFSKIPNEKCDWEKTLNIADMALYIGKTNGRNRAYGVGDLLVGHEIALPVIATDLSAAIMQNMVEMTEIIGPKQK